MRQNARECPKLLARPVFFITAWMMLLLLSPTLADALQAQTSGPIPHIDDIDIPSVLMYPGQPFDVEVWASNLGTDADGGGSITVSFPEGHDISILESDVPILPEDWSDCNYTDPHAWVLKPDSACHRALQHNTACREQVNLRYPLAETWHKPWRSGEKHYVKIRVFPSQDASHITVFVRLAMRAGTQGCDLRLEPDESTATVFDQQDFPVKALVITVSTPTPTLTSVPPPPTATLELPTVTPTPIPTATPEPPTSVPSTPTTSATAIPTPTTVRVLPPPSPPGPVGTPQVSGGLFSQPILGGLLGFVLAATLLLIILGGIILLFRKPPDQRLAASPSAGGSPQARPPRSQSPLSPLQPECLKCGANLRLNASFCRKCGCAVPVIGGRYPILRRLGQGGMGSVYLVQDKRIPGKRWAIKEMSDVAIVNLVDRQQAVDAFQREAQLLGTLDHPNLPRVTDFLSDEGCHYLVMDFIEGETLEDLLSQQAMPFSEAEVLDWACQLCDVLSYLHAQYPPVVFRDLKPGNIMLTLDEHLKLIDFGIARFFKPGQPGDTVYFGTPGYAPPEQYGQGQTDYRSDVYALGVTLHRLLTRHDPATTPFALPKVRGLNPQVSPRTERAISQATQLDPTHRFQSVAQMKQALGIT